VNGDPETEYQERLEAVRDLGLLLELWHRLDGVAQIPVLDGGLSAGLAIHNLIEHVTNLSEAVRLLVANDMSLPLVPLVRLSMECVVTAAWWAGDPGRVRFSGAEEVRQKKQLAAELARTASNTGVWVEIDGALGERASQLGSPTIEAKQFKDRCAATPGFDWAYGQYRMLSASSHAGTALVAEYLDDDSENAANRSGVVIKQRPTWFAQSIGLEVQVVLLVVALSTYDAVLPERPLRDELREFAIARGVQDLVEAVLAGIAK
jgi:hypothetical protein